MVFAMGRSRSEEACMCVGGGGLGGAEGGGQGLEGIDREASST